MDSRDSRLGMGRAIQRRDFLSGTALALGASLAPRTSLASTLNHAGDSPHYPPALTGLRGAHPGSFEVAHATVQGRHWAPTNPSEHYDLVVVGAGISGLAAAYTYRRDINPKARILLLDNHDDFGGHAKRNEFRHDGQTYIGYGGTMLIEAPGTYPKAARQILDELGVNTSRRSEFHHDDLFDFPADGLATFFDRETFGSDYLAPGNLDTAHRLTSTPLTPEGKQQLARLFEDTTDYLPGKSPTERRQILEQYSWRDYLAHFGGFGDEVLECIQRWPHGVWAIGSDALPAWMAWLQGYPGFAGMTLDRGGLPDHHEPNFRFPDGNATIARLLVNRLVPEVSAADTMEDIVSARFDYSALDQPDKPVRIRLNSTVVDIRHRSGQLQGPVDVTCVRAGKGTTVSGDRVIWAGYHAMLPHICPDLPPEQTIALGESVRAPLVYTNVLIRNWQSLEKLGVRRSYCPGSFFQTVMFTHAVSFGDYRFSRSPEQPVVLHMSHIPLAPGLPPAEQFRAGRRALLETPFEDYERRIRDQLGRMFGSAGFDPAEDILGITVNRWPHGYAYSVDSSSGDVAWWPEWWPHDRRPWVDARRRVGNIGIAGSDAAANAMTEAALEEAYRAVHSFQA